jgi:hypothetical protein
MRPGIASNVSGGEQVCSRQAGGILAKLHAMKMQTSPILTVTTLLCLAVAAPKAQAVSPAPDGGYPGFNTAEGDNALKNLNTATGQGNTAVGWFSLGLVTDGSFNTAIGVGALVLNTGSSNTATGAAALILNTTGERNTANGTAAMVNNDVGNDNTAVGDHALTSNVDGDDNTAVGSDALSSNTSGDLNTANGDLALFFNTTGSNNIALGVSAGFNLTTGDNNIDIGSTGVAAESSTIRIGSEFQGQTRTFIAAIRGVTTGNADTLPVLIDVNGQLGTAPSSRRFKKEIKPMDKASDVILALKPVTFHYKSDAKDTPQFGLVAEEVAEVNPDLVVRDRNGEIYTVRYDAVNAMLLNEFLKTHRKVEEQETIIAELRSTAEKQEATIARQQSEFQGTAARQEKEIQMLTAELKEQAAQIQNVSAQIELNRPAPQRVDLKIP